MKPKIAKKDITCYKILCGQLDGTLETPYYRYRMEVGKTYEEKKDFDLTGSCYIRRKEYAELTSGCFHTFKDKYDAIIYANNMMVRDIPIIIRCKIPKGTPYYEGINRDFGSKKLTLEEII